MSVLGAPLEIDTINAIKSRFPDFDGDVPAEAKHWSEEELEIFFETSGQVCPQDSLDSATCALLKQLRQLLSENKIREATKDYRSLSRHMREHGAVQNLAGVANTSEIPRSTSSSLRGMRVPGVLKSQGVFGAGGLGLDFWKQQYGGWLWMCHSRSPVFEGDASTKHGSVSVEASVADYVDYARLLMKVDSSFTEEDAIAFPRVNFDRWPAIYNAAHGLSSKIWKSLPLGVEDLTSRWVKMFSTTHQAHVGTDWQQYLTRYDLISIAAPGCITRLHKENNSAHIWLAQTDGRRAFVLFPPSDSECLYEMVGDRVECAEGYAKSVSAVDIFFPNLKRHPKFADAQAQVTVLEPGETLVIPAGWWWYAVALEPSCTIQHHFFNRTNQKYMVQDLEDACTFSTMTPDMRERVRWDFERLREMVDEDDLSDCSDVN